MAEASASSGGDRFAARVDRVPMSRIGSFIPAASTQSFIALGPFPGYGLFERVGIVFTGAITSLFDVAVSFGSFAGLDNNCFARLSPLFESSGRTVAGVSAISLQGVPNSGPIVLDLPAYRPMPTGSFWVSFGVQVPLSSRPRVVVWALVSHTMRVGSDGGDTSRDRAVSGDGAGAAASRPVAGAERG